MLEFSGIDVLLSGAPVLTALDLRVAAGEFVVVLGPSGCGKTTLLRLAAGMMASARGRVAVQCNRSALVFQEPRLAPWLDALDNAAFGLKALGVAPALRRAAARDLLLRLGLDAGDFRKRPAALSGGMRQRVAIARALAVEPQLLLMDEPFAALDVGLRRRLQDLVVDLTAASRVTTLFVTHDVTEAVRMATRIVVLSPRPAHVVADLPNRRVRDPALVYEAAAALLRREAVAGALLDPVEDASHAPAEVAAAPPGRRSTRCEKRERPWV